MQKSILYPLQFFLILVIGLSARGSITYLNDNRIIVEYVPGSVNTYVPSPPFSDWGWGPLTSTSMAGIAGASYDLYTGFPESATVFNVDFRLNQDMRMILSRFLGQPGGGVTLRQSGAVVLDATYVDTPIFYDDVLPAGDYNIQLKFAPIEPYDIYTSFGFQADFEAIPEPSVLALMLMSLMIFRAYLRKR
ncbi:hypothetical protein P0Y35_05040 [Kiritimatiellaeota bacterium B1221]|nr:hypothetical protein [Kiritimatiellaeota bacterium B1221]